MVDIINYSALIVLVMVITLSACAGVIGTVKVSESSSKPVATRQGQLGEKEK